MTRNLFTTLTLLPLLGCSAFPNSPNGAMIKVDSVPVGASVLVMGEVMGQTPMSLRKREVFPHLFAPQNQHLYGHIKLTYPGCEPFVTSVSSDIVSNGLKARLNCDNPPPLTPAQPAKTSPADNASEGLRQRLQQLKSLFEEGLISEQDYASKRRQLLEEL